MPLLPWKMNNIVSDFEQTKPTVAMKVAKRWYHAQGSCFRPYRERLRRHTCSAREESKKPVG